MKGGVIIPGGSLCESCAKKLMQGSNDAVKGISPVVPPKMPIIKGVTPMHFDNPFDTKSKEEENNNLSDEQKAETIDKGAKAIKDILNGED